MKFKEVRESKSMTQEQLAEKIGVKRTAIAMWETGKSYPRVDTLKKIAAVLECSIEELIGGE